MAQGFPTGSITAGLGRGLHALLVEPAVPGQGGPRRRVQLCECAFTTPLIRCPAYTLTAAPTSFVVVHR